ncbi:MAG: hypothetical protein K6T85_10125 [Gorillibacterium sp.]|nr:hypothetical protein [Gorillibacterium sp.]
MGRTLFRIVWIALLILFGVQLGVHQAEKRQADVAQTEVATNQSAQPQTGEERANGSNNGSVIKRTGLSNSIRGINYTGSALAGEASGGGEERVAESFLNRLGNKLGEALRMLVSSLIGWLAALIKSILN